MKNPTRTYLDKCWAMARAFAPEKRYSNQELNAAWRRAPNGEKHRLVRWMLHPGGNWQPMGPPDIDTCARS